jgi:hypothetical protein
MTWEGMVRDGEGTYLSSTTRTCTLLLCSGESVRGRLEFRVSTELCRNDRSMGAEGSGGKSATQFEICWLTKSWFMERWARFCDHVGVGVKLVRSERRKPGCGWDQVDESSEGCGSRRKLLEER